jgi:hypothetical protein
MCRAITGLLGGTLSGNCSAMPCGMPYAACPGRSSFTAKPGSGRPGWPGKSARTRS